MVGVVSAVIVQVLKVFPALTISDERKRLTALGVSIVSSVGYVFLMTEGSTSVDYAETIVTALSTSFVVYKAVIQPVAEVAMATAARLRG